MQDDHESYEEQGSDLGPQTNVDDEADIEREALLEERRNRQMGKRKGSLNGVLFLVFCVASILMISGVLFGFGTVMQFFGLRSPEEESQQTSQVDLDVERPKRESKGPELDFVVKPQFKKKVAEKEPNADLEKKFVALQKKFKELEAQPNDPDVSPEDMEKMLKSYNEEMATELEKQRAEMQLENEKLVAEMKEAEKREEQRKKEEEEKRLAKEREATDKEVNDLQNKSSGVIVDNGSAVRATNTENAAMTNSTSGYQSAVRSSSSLTSSGSSQSANQQFLDNAASSEFVTSVSKTLTDTSATVIQGTIISGVLETAINTELPGNIRGQVMEPVFSYDGKNILMPAGTVLIGTFNSNIMVAQKRVLIAWNRAITPDGVSIALGGTGTDVLGRSGTGGNVDSRFKQKLGAAALITSIVVVPKMIAAAVTNNGSDTATGATINIGGSNNSGSDIAGSATESLEESSSDILEEYLSLPPIIRVPQGEEIRIFVNRDLVFK